MSLYYGQSSVACHGCWDFEASVTCYGHHYHHLHLFSALMGTGMLESVYLGHLLAIEVDPHNFTGIRISVPDIYVFEEAPNRENLFE